MKIEYPAKFESKYPVYIRKASKLAAEIADDWRSSQEEDPIFDPKWVPEKIEVSVGQHAENNKDIYTLVMKAGGYQVEMWFKDEDAELDVPYLFEEFPTIDAKNEKLDLSESNLNNWIEAVENILLDDMSKKEIVSNIYDKYLLVMDKIEVDTEDDDDETVEDAFNFDFEEESDDETYSFASDDDSGSDETNDDVTVGCKYVTSEEDFNGVWLNGNLPFPWDPVIEQHVRNLLDTNLPESLYAAVDDLSWADEGSTSEQFGMLVGTDNLEMAADLAQQTDEIMWKFVDFYKENRDAIDDSFEWCEKVLEACKIDLSNFEIEDEDDEDSSWDIKSTINPHNLDNKMFEFQKMDATVTFSGINFVCEVFKTPIDTDTFDVESVDDLFRLSTPHNDTYEVYIPGGETVTVKYDDTAESVSAKDFIDWQLINLDTETLYYFINKCEAISSFENFYDMDEEIEKDEDYDPADWLWENNEYHKEKAMEFIDRMKNDDPGRFAEVLRKNILDENYGLLQCMETTIEDDSIQNTLKEYSKWPVMLMVVTVGNFEPYIEFNSDNLSLDDYSIDSMHIRNYDETESFDTDNAYAAG